MATSTLPGRRSGAIGRIVDRRAGGSELGQRLRLLALQRPVVLGIARGGIPVAWEVAKALAAPLDVYVVRKLCAPRNPELAIGAIAEGGACVVNRGLLRELQVGPEDLEQAVTTARRELVARTELYRAGRAAIPIRGRDVILVDDGLATGATARAAVRDLRARDGAKIILAVPVGAAATVESLRFEADAVLCLRQPDPLYAVGRWYEEFDPTTDDEVRTLLARSHGAARTGGAVVPTAR